MSSNCVVLWRGILRLGLSYTTCSCGRDGFSYFPVLSWKWLYSGGLCFHIQYQCCSNWPAFCCQQNNKLNWKWMWLKNKALPLPTFFQPNKSPALVCCSVTWTALGRGSRKTGVWNRVCFFCKRCVRHYGLTEFWVSRSQRSHSGLCIELFTGATISVVFKANQEPGTVPMPAD